MITENSYFHYSVANDLETRGIASNLLFHKSLLLHSSSSNTTVSEHRVKKKKKFSMKIKNNKNDNTSSSGDIRGGTGSVLKLFQMKISVIENLFLETYVFWDRTLQILICTIFPYHCSGSSVLCGISVILCTIE